MNWNSEIDIWDGLRAGTKDDTMKAKQNYKYRDRLHVGVIWFESVDIYTWIIVFVKLWEN